MITEKAKTRNDLLGSVGIALGTLRSAVSTVNIGEGITGCENPVVQARQIAFIEIEQIERDLIALKKTLE